ncbi:MAG TPA: diaminopimelate epimerase, partial [Terriglobales bacterium]|nr:diaminopimelate epimerase [Terriglobales bacterium]
MNAPAHGIPFLKASACGNDFLIIDAANAPADLAAISRRVCERHNGVGADGVEWLFPDTEADVFARLFNADGSEAEVSGNGTRCVAAALCARTGKGQVIVRTGAGLKTCRLTGRRGATFEFETDMGQPTVGEPASIDPTSPLALGTEISMGNPHFVIFVDTFPETWQRDASLIGAQPRFAQGTNVEYVVVRGPNEIEIRLFERGVGETESSGTGSCASAVAAIASGRVSSPVTVIAPGGAQTVRWDKNVYLTGPATLI